MTYAQHQASNPLASVWVGASAGTGKTKVLTDRVMRLLLDGVDPSKIVCLTFTKAAAAEMANRISHKLGDWVLMEEAKLYHYLEQLTGARPDNDMMQRARNLFAVVMQLPEGLNIQTIHAFCQSLIKKFPLEAGVVPHASVMDEEQARGLIVDAINKVALQANADCSQLAACIEHVIAHVWEGRFQELLESFAHHRHRLASIMTDEGFVDMSCRINASLGVNNNASASHIVVDGLNGDALSAVLPALASSGKEDKQRCDLMSKWLSVDNDTKVVLFNDYKSAFLTASGDPKKRLISKKALEVMPTALEILSTEQERVMRVDDALKAAAIAKLSHNVLAIGQKVLLSYRDMKRQRAMLDYQDLILLSLQLLQRQDIAPWVLYKLDGGIDHLLVDEAQDTSPTQWKIVEAITAEFFAGAASADKHRSVFVVGDEKQSIYRFQGADVDSFYAMEKHFEASSKYANMKWQSIALDRSFRSTEAVLTLVDHVFAKPHLHQAITASGECVQHNVHRVGQAGQVVLYPLHSEEVQEEEMAPWVMPVQRIEPNNPISELAKTIASTIHGWIDGMRILPSAGRPIQAGDVLILVRRRTVLVNYLMMHLKQLGVPVAGADRMVLFDHIAVQDMMALGQFLLLPHDDLVLASLLKSPLCGWSEEQLFELLFNRQASVFDTLYRRQDECELFKETYCFLSRLLNKVDRVTPFELFSYVIEACQGRSKMVARLGEQVHDPLDEFLSMALTYEMTDIASMQGFMQSLEHSSADIKRDMDAGANALRIMTVHGSKGLQAPIVWLADTTAVPQTTDQLLWQDQDVFLWSPGSEYDCQLTKNLKQNERKSTYQEYIRLLYVAMTRAEDELHIAGMESKKSSSSESWYDILKSSMEALGHINEDGVCVYSCEQKEVVTCAGVYDEAPTSLKVQDDAFIDRQIEQEPKALVPLTAATNIALAEVDSHNQASLQRGQLVHTLLQYLPSVPVDDRMQAAQFYLDRAGVDLADQDKQQLGERVIDIIQAEAFADLFSRQAFAEVPIVGNIGKYRVHGIVDRLLVTDTHVLVVDYKTDLQVPETVSNIAKPYLRQLGAYVHLLARIHPLKEVKAAILWTQAPLLMPVDDDYFVGFFKTDLDLEEHSNHILGHV